MTKPSACITLAIALVLQLAPASAIARAEQAPPLVESRFISLDGAQNFRDIGGYRTADGRWVKRGLLYRSGTLGELSAAGEARLAALHPVAIIDLRSTDERARDKNTAWLQARPGYWTRDYGMSLGDMAKMFGDPSKLTAERMRAMMTVGYRSMYREQVPAYRLLFARLIEGRGPVVLNCTAGKDRTGIGAALVLTALGVPYPTIREDFLLSNRAIDPAKLADTIGSPLSSLPPDVVAPLLGVDGAYLDAAFDQIRKDYGSVESFLAKALGVGPGEIARLRRRMLA